MTTSIIHPHRGRHQPSCGHSPTVVPAWISVGRGSCPAGAGQAAGPAGRRSRRPHRPDHPRGTRTAGRRPAACRWNGHLGDGAGTWCVFPRTPTKLAPSGPTPMPPGRCCVPGWPRRPSAHDNVSSTSAPWPRVYLDLLAAGVRGEEAASTCGRSSMANDEPRSRAARRAAERALVRVVHHYGARPEFVVLGGLVPELLCAGSDYKHAGTTDVDVQGPQRPRWPNASCIRPPRRDSG